MIAPNDVTAPRGYPEDLLAIETLVADEGVDPDQEINERRAQAENPEALRLARAL